MNSLLYEFKPLTIFAVGFLAGILEHPIKWLAVTSLILAAIIIVFKRFQSREDHIVIHDIDQYI